MTCTTRAPAQCSALLTVAVAGLASFAHAAPISNHERMQTAAEPHGAWNVNTQYGRQTVVDNSQGSAVWAVLDGNRGTPLTAVSRPATWPLRAAGGLPLAAQRQPWQGPAAAI